MTEIKFCPICGKTGTIKIITRPNKTRFCKCSNCEEEFVPGGMMNENLKILRKERKEETELCDRCGRRQVKSSRDVK